MRARPIWSRRRQRRHRAGQSGAGALSHRRTTRRARDSAGARAGAPTRPSTPATSSSPARPAPAAAWSPAPASPPARGIAPDAGRALRVGFCYLKQMGERSLDRIEEERRHGPFTSFEDFYLRTRIDYPVAENLIRVGAFDSLEPDRTELLWRLPLLHDRLEALAGVVRTAARPTAGLLLPAQPRRTRALLEPRGQGPLRARAPGAHRELPSPAALRGGTPPRWACA